MENTNKKAVVIMWRDASGLADDSPTEWFNLEFAIKSAKEKYESMCQTAGWIIHENKNYLVIATTKSDGIYSDITMIPKVLIDSRTGIKSDK